MPGNRYGPDLYQGDDAVLRIDEQISLKTMLQVSGLLSCEGSFRLFCQIREGGYYLLP